MSDWRGVYHAILPGNALAGDTYRQGDARPYQQWLRQNTAVAGEFHHQTYERPCTCHPSEAPVPCEHRYAFNECQEQQRWRRFYCII